MQTSDGNLRRSSFLLNNSSIDIEQRAKLVLAVSSGGGGTLNCNFEDEVVYGKVGLKGVFLEV